MTSIGGYLGLELNTGKQYHSSAIDVNSGRNALAYILNVNEYKKVYIPLYTCDAVLKPILDLGLDYEFYKINDCLEPVFDFSKQKTDEVFLYTNYFGLKSDYIKNTLVCNKPIIIDNAQAFYDKPIEGVDTFYSPRKFFGIPDGGYAYTEYNLKRKLPLSTSYTSLTHLIKQVDLSIESGYSDYIANEKKIDDAPLEKMSVLTGKLLENIDYEDVAHKRVANFKYLEHYLAEINQLKLTLGDAVPLSYPLLLKVDVQQIRDKLISKKIYLPIYWKNVLEWSENTNTFECKLVNHTLHLPIDQRYTVKDMEVLVGELKKIIGNE